MTELAVEDTPAVAASAREAASGQVVYITDHGHRLAAIVPPEVARLATIPLGIGALLERLSPDQLSELEEDLADTIAAMESLEEPGENIPWEQIKAEAGL
jgi:hypothetical protein